MEFIVQISIQIIIAVGTIITAHLTVKGTVKQEVIRLQFQKNQKLEDDFSNMCKEVTHSLDCPNKRFAREAVSAMRGRFTFPLAETLDKLENSINDPIKSKALLDQAINEYRELIFGHKNSKTSKRRRSSK